MPTNDPPHDDAPCLQCDRPAERHGLCFPCAAADELRPTEPERVAMRDLLASMFEDEDGTPDYRSADHVWLTLYRAGFDIMRRPIAETAA